VENTLTATARDLPGIFFEEGKIRRDRWEGKGSLLTPEEKRRGEESRLCCLLTGVEVERGFIRTRGGKKKGDHTHREEKAAMFRAAGKAYGVLQ